MNLHHALITPYAKGDLLNLTPTATGQWLISGPCLPTSLPKRGKSKGQFLGKTISKFRRFVNSRDPGGGDATRTLLSHPCWHRDDTRIEVLKSSMPSPPCMKPVK
ncbi:hypothetical protein ABVK25_004352 [Lepraria finkii]|uniref:Uncharacterized protein n=1 Tax=Lepraria finkii TaxID=1340010 RepID=A0ABR4BCH8_9LECA